MAQSWNFFDSFQAGGALGREDFLTASLIALFRGIPELQLEFLRWLQPHIHFELTQMRWEIDGQQTYRTQKYGDARPDMVFSNATHEIWFEHKWGAEEGRTIARDGSGDEITQLAKYLRAAKQHGQEAGKEILLVFITANPKVVHREAVQPIHSASHRSGFVWAGTSGHLVWSDFYPVLIDVLTAREQMTSRSDLQTALLSEFVKWWETRPGLVKPPVSPHLYDEELRAGAVQVLCDWMNSALAIDAKTTPNGGEAAIVRPSRSDIFHIRAWPRIPRDVADWNHVELGNDVLYVHFRTKDLSRLDGLKDSWLVVRTGERCRLVVVDNEKKGWRTAEFHVALTGWQELHSEEGRRQRLLRVIEATFSKFHELSGIDLTAPERRI